MKSVIKNEYIYEYLKPFKNDKLSKLNGKDIQNIIWCLNNYYLKMRDTLNIDNDLTFGLELEVEYAKESQINKKMRENKLNIRWDTKRDLSLQLGLEIASPLLRDCKKDWEELICVCNILKNNSEIRDHCGGHIHIGSHILGDCSSSWLNFLKIWTAYENVIFRFCYGEFLTNRKYIYKYANSISSDLESIINDFYKKKNASGSALFLLHLLPDKRENAINFRNVTFSTDSKNKFDEGNTIEFRCPNGSTNPVIWQNNVNMLLKLLLCSKYKELDQDKLNYKMRINQDYSFEYYNEIFLQDSLEFADLIFDNNLDKIYFLRQYLKYYKVGKTPLEKYKTFTK